MIPKQDAKRFEGRIFVGEPQQQHLFESNLPVEYSSCTAVEPLGGADFTAIDGHARKLLDEGKEKPFDFSRGQASAKPANRLRHDGRIYVMAITGDESVAQLVNQSHGKQRARIRRWGRISL